MPKFTVTLYCTRRELAIVTVEADNAKQAEDKAVFMEQKPWHEDDVIDVGVIKVEALP